MTGLEVLLILGLLGAGAVVSLGLLWVASRLLRVDDSPGGLDPILGARDRVAIYRIGRPAVPHHPQVLIPVPDTLETRDEMVAWMTRELPRLTEEAARFRAAPVNGALRVKREDVRGPLS